MKNLENRVETLNQVRREDAKATQAFKDHLEARTVHDVKKYVDNLDLKVTNLANDLGNNHAEAHHRHRGPVR